MLPYPSCILTISLVCKYATIINDFVFFFLNQTQNQARLRIVTGGGLGVLKPRGGSLSSVLAVSLCPKSVWPTFKDRCLSLERFCNDAQVVLGRIYQTLKEKKTRRISRTRTLNLKKNKWSSPRPVIEYHQRYLPVSFIKSYKLRNRLIDKRFFLTSKFFVYFIIETFKYIWKHFLIFFYLFHPLKFKMYSITITCT